jgi:hypothetical protein
MPKGCRVVALRSANGQESFNQRGNICDVTFRSVMEMQLIMKLYIIRHCKAMGQSPEAELTSEGLTQAEILADFLAVRGIETIISSPFVRTIRSIQPLAQRLNLEIKFDDRLVERVLSSENIPD